MGPWEDYRDSVSSSDKWVQPWFCQGSEGSGNSARQGQEGRVAEGPVPSSSSHVKDKLHSLRDWPRGPQPPPLPAPVAWPLKLSALFCLHLLCLHTVSSHLLPHPLQLSTGLPPGSLSDCPLQGNLFPWLKALLSANPLSQSQIDVSGGRRSRLGIPASKDKEWTKGPARHAPLHPQEPCSSLAQPRPQPQCSCLCLYPGAPGVPSLGSWACLTERALAGWALSPGVSLRKETRLGAPTAPTIGTASSWSFPVQGTATGRNMASYSRT